MGKLGPLSTSQEALRGADLTGKIAIVTGGNTGIGLQTVKTLANAGAKVYIACRDVEKAKSALMNLMEQKIKGRLVIIKLDLADLNSIYKFASDFAKSEQYLHYLICNAGIIVTSKQFTKQGFDKTIGINHIGHQVLIKLLIDIMVQQDHPARVVLVSSDYSFYGNLNFSDLMRIDNQRYYGLWAYSDSKLCNVLYAKFLSHELQGTKVKAYSVAPGIVLTSEFHRYQKDFLSLQTYKYLQFMMKLSEPFLIILSGGLIQNPDQGAASTIYAAIAPELEYYSGSFIRNCAIFENKKGTNINKAIQLNDVCNSIISKAVKDG